jgi:isopenicillin-N epimerase
MEAEPVRFFLREAPGLLADARRVLADFVGADWEGLVMVPNATTGVNAVLRSIPLSAGDEILSTAHGYPACRFAAREIAAASGARAVEVALPTRISGPGEVVERVVDAIVDRTRLLVVDMVTSPTALVLPVAPIVAAARERGVPVLVDGAHAPGMLDLNVVGLGADFFTGNCHKWLCAPKGAGFLWVAPSWRERVRPVVLSHAAGLPSGPERFVEEFAWTGTADPTPACCVPAAIESMETMVPGGWPEVRRRNRELVAGGLETLLTLDALEPVGPPDMLGSMAAVVLPEAPEVEPPETFGWDRLQGRLFDEFGIEVPVVVFPAWPRRVLRISAQLYNRPDEYVALARALRQLLGR